MLNSSCHILTSITNNGCRLSLLAAELLSLILSLSSSSTPYCEVLMPSYQFRAEKRRCFECQRIDLWRTFTSQNSFFKMIQLSPIWPCRQPIQRHIWQKKPPLHSIKMVVSICIDITIDRWCHQYYGIGTIVVAPVSSCCLASSMSTINIIIMLNIITYDQYQDYHRYHQQQQYHNWQICSAVPSIPWWSYLLLVLIHCWYIHIHNNFPSFIFT